MVASARPQPLVDATVRALGAQRAVGTRAEVCDGRFTGRLEGPFCHGRRLRREARRQGWPVLTF